MIFNNEKLKLSAINKSKFIRDFQNRNDFKDQKDNPISFKKLTYKPKNIKSFLTNPLKLRF